MPNAMVMLGVVELGVNLLRDGKGLDAMVQHRYLILLCPHQGKPGVEPGTKTYFKYT